MYPWPVFSEVPPAWCYMVNIDITLIEIHFGTHGTAVGMAIGPFGTEIGSPGNHHFIAFAQRRRLPGLAIDEPHALEGAPKAARGTSW